jgi:hypothetical protein
MGAFALNESGKMSLQVLPIGEDGEHRALIFDDFFAFPHQVRQAALNPGLPWKDADSHYPGMTAAPGEDLSHILRFLGTRLDRRIEPDAARAVFSMVTKTDGELSPLQQRPHFDGPCVAAIAYLNLPDQCCGGTAFFRHRATGLVRFPDRMTAAHLGIIKRLGLASPRDLQKLVSESPAQPKGFIEASSDEWERIGHVEMKFNRMVIYDGQIFHSGIIPKGAFGTSREERRLTLNLFLQNP